MIMLDGLWLLEGFLEDLQKKLRSTGLPNIQELMIRCRRVGWVGGGGGMLGITSVK